MPLPRALEADEIHRAITVEELRAVRAGGLLDRSKTIGQDRALEALRLGLALDAPGFHVFVCGPSGTGKMSTVRAVLAEGLLLRRPLRDFMFVENFDDRDRPRLLEMPAGHGRRFRKAIETFVDGLREVLARALDVDDVERTRRAQTTACEKQEADELAAFEKRCKSEKFALARIQLDAVEQLDVMPIHRREPVDIDVLNERARSGEARVPRLAEINRMHGVLKEELRLVLSRLRRAAFRARDEIEEIERKAARATLMEHLGQIRERFPFEGVGEWLEQMADWLADHARTLHDDEDEDGHHAVRHALRVNVVLDNTGKEGAPVIFESSPSFANLLGTVEQPAGEARSTLDFGDIKGGSLLRADRGVLVVHADDAVQHEGVWRTLTRILRTRALGIQSPEQVLSPAGGSALKPEAIPVDVKVIAVGDDQLFRLLHTSSDDFRRVFKLKAEFDELLPDTPETLATYAAHADRVVQEEGLLPLTETGLARLCEYGVRLGGRQGWLSARFGRLTDLLREAAFYAARPGAGGPRREDAASAEPSMGGIDHTHIDRALDAAQRRHGLPEDRLRELVAQGVLDVATHGHAVGMANALTVLDLGDHAFGQPCRMSATVAPGHDGLISVEREVELSGRIHDKGTLILAGYLRHYYLPERPMALSATITFEQLHEEVDGDSASAAEALALISALARVPVFQGIAVTGAIDQQGNVMAVGGVIEKVLGFFRLCALRGLDGTQGVVMPAENARDVVLPMDVVEAVRAGLFRLWVARNLNEIVELATGIPAGERQPDGHFPAGTVNAGVADRLVELAERSGPAVPFQPRRVPYSTAPAHAADGRDDD